ncbi:hypothetical protein FB451DRAFT_1162441 [Mycena latifolia]|nr:hypothetical protein FB451DRAFT_1162441 [Mycena latifolia]
MSDPYLDWIWSRYTTSPDPASSVESLYRTCSALTKHVLLPSDIILSSGGFTICPDLAVALTDIIPAMDHLLRLAAQYHGLNSTPSIGLQELQLLTVTTGLHRATQNEIVLAWVTILDRLSAAMRELKALCVGNPSDSSLASNIPRIASALPLTLRTKLPKSLLAFYGISTSLLSHRVASIARKTSLDPSDVVDRGVNPDRLIARYALEDRLVVSIENTVQEMQRELTEAFSPTSDRSTCFIVDPHGVLLRILRGASTVEELRVAWTGLSMRTRVAQVRLGQYQAETAEKGSRTSAESPRVRHVPSLTENPSFPSSTPVRSSTSTPACAKHHGSRPSVKTLVAAIEEREREASSSANLGPLRDELQELLNRHLEIHTLAAVNETTTARSARASRHANAELRTAGVRSKSHLKDHRVEDAVVTPLMGVLEFPVTVLLGISLLELRTLETLVRPASFQFSAPANPVVNPTAVELGGLGRESCAQPESIAACIDTRLTAASSIPDAARAPRALSPWFPAPALVFDEVELGGSKRSPSAEDEQVVTPFTEGVSADVMPLLSVSQFPTPAVVKNEAVEHGELKVSRQQHGLPDLETHTSDRIVRASSSAPSADAFGAVCDVFACEHPVFKSPAPAMAVELGGLECSDQELVSLDSKTRTWDEPHCANEDGPLTTALPSSVLPAPAPVFDGGLVELGGLDEERHVQAELVPSANSAMLLTEWSWVKDEAVITCKARASRRVITELRVVGIRSKSHLRDHGINGAVVRPSRRILKFPAPAVLDIEAAVELGGLKESRQRLGRPDLEIRTVEMMPRASDPPPGASVAARDASTCGVGVHDTPAAALVSEGSPVELGGLEPSLSAQHQPRSTSPGSTVRTKAPTSPLHSSILLSASLSVPVNGIFALVSAIIRTFWITCLMRVSREELAPYMAWPREGIGTRCFSAGNLETSDFLTFMERTHDASDG